MLVSPVRLLAGLALLVLPAGLSAQLPLFVAGFAGGAFNTDQNSPGEGSGGFSYQTGVGVRLRHVSFGAEYSHHNTGGDFKSKVFGGFVRLPSYIGESSVQVYLVMGLGAYQFTPSGGSRTTVGGSLGPGVSFGLRGIPVALDFEARFHSTFDQLPRINNQQFISAIGGLELRF